MLVLSLKITRIEVLESVPVIFKPTLDFNYVLNFSGVIQFICMVVQLGDFQAPVFCFIVENQKINLGW